MTNHEKLSQEDQISAYVENLMSPEQRADFERLLERDEDLRQKLEQYQGARRLLEVWMEEDPPGISRTDQLDMKHLERIRMAFPRRKKVILSGAKVRFVQAMAAAAIFLLGFLIGAQATFKKASERETVTKTQTTQQAIPTQAKPDEKPRSIQIPGPEETTSPPDEIQRRVTKQNGRIIIETTKDGAGTRSLWIVDGSFCVACADEGK